MHATDALGDAARSMEICNACRYCETYCAVFPAMELHREFKDADLSYLANLCHGCKGCYYACQYAPPHAFGINLPQAFAQVRHDSYAQHAWPAGAGTLFARNGTLVSLVAALAIALVLLLTPGTGGAHTGPGAFYAVIPYGVMLAVAGATFLYALLAICMAVRSFWRASGGAGPVGVRAWLKALHDAATLKNLGGGGHGCNDRDGSFRAERRWFHHALFYGFALCFAATSVATVYHHFLGWEAPYPLLSLPVVLGTLGGAGMLVGCGGLIWLKIVGDTEPTARNLLGGEYALLVLLLLAAATGLLLLALRDTPAMGALLALHLGCILALFLVLPYSRMLHGPFRLAALLRAAHEGAGH